MKYHTKMEQNVTISMQAFLAYLSARILFCTIMIMHEINKSTLHSVSKNCFNIPMLLSIFHQYYSNLYHVYIVYLVSTFFAMVYPPSECVDILLILGESRGVYRRAARLYAERYPNRQLHPSPAVIRQIEINCRRGRIGQRQCHERFIRDDSHTLTILAMIHMNPHVSLRGIERDLGVPRSTAHRILRSVRYHPYRITLTQALSLQDRQNRINFCNWALERLNEEPDFFRYVLFSDEATFQSTGSLNRHNCHYWSVENPHWTQQIDHQHRWSLNVWCGIVDGQINGPYFFDGTVDGPNYLQFLQNELPVLMEDVPLATRQRAWFQQDGAPPHFARVVRDYLNIHFPNRWIGRGGFVSWPPRSPDLTPLDFYLWGYVKDIVYTNRPTTPVDLKQRIRDAIANIPAVVLRSVIGNFQRRLELCLNENGGNIEHLLR